MVKKIEKLIAGKGLDVGTSFIHAAKKIGSQVSFKNQRNCFFDIERSDFTENILRKSQVRHILTEDRIYVLGNDALKFANAFGKTPRRPMKRGVISPEEIEALPILEMLIMSVLEQANQKAEICYYSVPAMPVDADFDTVYHQNMVKGFLEKLNYQPKPINEGLAVIYSELAEDNFTGMGISLGGGMANACLAMMAIPVFSFSVARAGDWLDEQTARAVNEPVGRVTVFKEKFLNLKKSETNMTRIEQALSIYYNHLIEYILNEIKRKIEKNTIPKFEKPIKIVISGGTASPPGFIERFRELFKKTNLPLEVGEIKLASHLLYSVAKGALIAAIAEGKKETG